MKKIVSFLAAYFVLAFLFFAGCKKEKFARISIQIDHLEAGGYYNDDIEAVPSGLTLGLNGTYLADPNKTYTLEYKASNNFPTIKRTWKPTTAVWKIHCYVQGNVAYLQLIPGTQN